MTRQNNSEAERTHDGVGERRIDARPRRDHRWHLAGAWALGTSSRSRLQLLHIIEPGKGTGAGSLKS